MGAFHHESPVEIQLTRNGVQKLFGGKEVISPTLQIMEMHGPNVRKEFECLLSDGECYAGPAVFQHGLNHRINSNEISVYSIIKVDLYEIRNQTLVVIGCTTLLNGNEVPTVVGNPLLLEKLLRPSSSSQTVPDRFTRIDVLAPYISGWTIRARVSMITGIQKYVKEGKCGYWCRMDLVDESGEITAIAFNELAVKHSNMMQKGHVYFISNCKVEPINENFLTPVKNSFELFFTDATNVTRCKEETDIPPIVCRFKSLSQIYGEEQGSIVDAIGICTQLEDLNTVIQRSNSQELSIRRLSILDESGQEMRLTLWRNIAENFQGELSCVVLIKGARKDFFKDPCLTSLRSSTVEVNPNIPETKTLKTWFKNESKKRLCYGTNFRALGEILADELEFGDKVSFSCIASPTLIVEDDCLYRGCPSSICKTKLDLINDLYYCKKCKQSYFYCVWRYKLLVYLCDSTGSIRATLFEKEAEILLQCTVRELLHKKETDTEEFHKVFQEPTYKLYSWKLEITENGDFLNTTVRGISPVNLRDHNKNTIADIKRLIPI